ncbi:hypothetical protein CTI12_AA576280 [Artemisia annua]|uniref:Uncharacterized protein n=1 Tax=Artemisia annua TaxID=35608 RepID=A0A2U1KQF2_ARTAN|nr:hypothetical protein CTI12_AA576280 [Artemisia annua]
MDDMSATLESNSHQVVTENPNKQVTQWEERIDIMKADDFSNTIMMYSDSEVDTEDYREEWYISESIEKEEGEGQTIDQNESFEEHLSPLEDSVQILVSSQVGGMLWIILPLTILQFLKNRSFLQSWIQNHKNTKTFLFFQKRRKSV